MRHAILNLTMALAMAAGCTPPASETEAEAVAAAPRPFEGDQAAYGGAAIAAQVCAQCHDVGMGAKPAMAIGAPDFRTIAGAPESTADGLAAWMQANHPKMPNFLFSPAEVKEMAAYIMSLRGQPGE